MNKDNICIAYSVRDVLTKKQIKKEKTKYCSLNTTVA
jgi:hypothetical protein